MIQRFYVIVIAAICAAAKVTPGQMIDTIEYFFDVDPGPGNGTQVLTTPGTTIDESFDIPAGIIAVLPDGHHLLVCRVRDDQGNWSVAFTRALLKANVDPIDPTAPDIVSGEYFFDVDPGPGNGTAFAIADATAVNVTFAIPPEAIAPLPDGTHFVAIRVQDVKGNWSSAFTRMFRKANIDPIDDTLPDIIGGEYFIDIDPGPGNGTHFDVTGATSVDEMVDIPSETIAALDRGIHRVAARVQDTDGDWSSAFTRVFFKMPDPGPPPPEVLMQRIDYRWLVERVQVGNIISFVPGQEAKVIIFNELVSLAGLQQGQTAVLEVTPWDTNGNRGVSAYESVLIDTTDSDGDGVPDQWEIFYGFDPGDITDMALNADDDDLTNEEEFLAGTDPFLTDTDGDLMNDSAEVLLVDFGFDPNVDNSGLRDDLYEAAVGAGLYAEPQIRNLNVNVPLIQRDAQTGQIPVRFHFEQSSALLLNDYSHFMLTPENTATDAGDLLIELPGETEDTFYIRLHASKALQ